VKVVIAHNRYRSTQPSGENVIVDAEIAQLEAAGVDVVPFLRSSDDIASLPALDRVMLPASPTWSRRAQRDLAEVLRQHRPDVLHLHNPYPLISPWVVRTAHAHGVPVVHTVHNYRQVCSSGIYFRDGHLCTDCKGRAFGLPAVVHACYRESRAQSALMATALAVHRGTWRSVDRFIALTSQIEAHLRDYGIAAERITVKPNSSPDPGSPPGPGAGFLFAARLSAEKGLDLLLSAWQRHPVGALGELRIVGDGPLRGVAEAAAAARGDVTFLGPIEHSRVRDEMRASAVFLAPSTWHDVLPTVIIEALANGRPVLGTDLGGIPYLIDAGSTSPAGWVVPATVDALAAALPVARDGAAALVPVARERYLSTFHPDVVLTQLLAVYAAARRHVS
jgi:glycosyltransferase involved in cell wall biosynthesis